MKISYYILLFSILCLIFAFRPFSPTAKVKLVNNCGKSVSIRIQLDSNGLQTSLSNGESKEYQLKIDSKIEVNSKEIHKVTSADDGKEVKLCP